MMRRRGAICPGAGIAGPQARTARAGASAPGGGQTNRRRSGGTPTRRNATPAGGPPFAGGMENGTRQPERSRGTRHGEARAPRGASPPPGGRGGGARGTEAKRPSPPKRRNSLKPGLCVLARGRRAASKWGAADGGAGDQRRPRFCMAAERGRPHEAPLLTFPPLSTVLGEAQNEPLRPGGGWERGVKGGKRRGAEGGRQSDR